MKHLFTLLALTTLFNVSFAQKREPYPADQYVKTINANFKAGKLVKKQLNYMSPLGGDVEGYYLNQKLVFIKTTYGGECGYHSYDFYIKNDTLVFVKEIAKYCKIIDGDKYTAYIAAHTDRNGNTDMTKWPLETDDNNRYYIDDNHIIDFILKSFVKPTKAYEDIIAAKSKEIIEHYNSHLQELRQQ